MSNLPYDAGVKKVEISSNATLDVTLQNAATSVGNGTPLDVEGFKTLTIEITGTSATRTILFEGSSLSGAYYAMMGTKLTDFSTAIQTTGTGEIWQFDITGLVNFRARISAISGGNVNVKGRVIA